MTIDDIELFKQQLAADAERILQNPEFQKAHRILMEQWKGDQRIDPALLAQALGAKPLEEAGEVTRRKLNARRGPF